MNLSPVIQQIRTYATIFGGRVAGAAEFRKLQEDVSLTVPAAVVIPLDDSPDDNQALNDIFQVLVDSFAVIVCINNTADEKGHAAVESAHDVIRTQLWAALLGWQPDGLGPLSRYRGILYQGGHLLNVDRSRLWYEFDFGAEMQIISADGWQETELGNLPHLDTMHINEDDIAPAYDPNLVAPGSLGPDGRIEHVLTIPQTGTLP